MQADRPINQFRETFKKSIKENKELVKYVFEKSDNISLWLIGLAISGIAIFANNIADIQKIFAPHTLRPILLLLAISVASGIIYRSLYLYFFVLLNHALRGIEISFSKKKTMDTESCLRGNESFEELLEKVEDNMGDLKYLKDLYAGLDEEKKQILYNSVVMQYLDSIAFAVKDTELSIDFIADTYSKFMGLKKEKLIEKMSSPGTGRKYKWTIRFTTFFYLLYIFCFLTALFMFVLAT